MLEDCGKGFLVNEQNNLDREFIRSGGKVMETFKFPNGNGATFGYDMRQVPMLQGVYSKELVQKIKEYSDAQTKWTGY